jgi:hypothetical protein
LPIFQLPLVVVWDVAASERVASEVVASEGVVVEADAPEALDPLLAALVVVVFVLTRGWGSVRPCR